MNFNVCKDFVLGIFLRWGALLEDVVIGKYCTLKIALLWKFLLILRICIHLVNKLHCNLAFSVEMLVLWKTVFLGNCVTMKNSVTWKLRYFEKLRYLKTVLLWKTVLLEKLRYFEKLRYLKTVLLWKTVLLEKLRWGALLVKYCVGVRYFKILLYCKNVALFEKWFSLKTALLRKLCYAEKLWFWRIALLWKLWLKKVLRWGALLVKYCVGVRYFKNFNHWIIFALLYLK